MCEKKIIACLSWWFVAELNKECVSVGHMTKRNLVNFGADLDHGSLDFFKCCCFFWLNFFFTNYHEIGWKVSDNKKLSNFGAKP